MNLSPLWVLYGLEIIGFFVIGLLTVLGRKAKVYTMFFIFASCLGIWQLFQVLALIFSENRILSVGLLMTSVLFSAILAASLYAFTSVYTRKRGHHWAVFVIAVFVGSLAYLSDGLREVAIKPDGIGIPRLDLYYGVVLVFGASVLLASVIRLIAFYRASRNVKERTQTGMMLTSIGVAGVLIVFSSFYTSDFSQTGMAQQVIPIVCLLALIGLSYAMTKHGLFDIKLAAVRTVAYGLSLVTLAAIYYLIAYIVSVTLFGGQTATNLSVSPINITLALILAFIFQPVKQFFDRVTNRIFFRDRYDTNEFYAKLSELLTSTTDLRPLLKSAAEEIAGTLKTEQVFFVVQHNHAHNIVAGTKHHTSLPGEDVQFLDEYVANQGDSIIVTDLLEEGSHLRRLLASHKIAMLMPLMRSASILGYVALGDQRSTGYTKRDIRVLNTISDELVIAIQNALSVQEVKDINANLEQRIEAATAELRTSNARLKRLDTTKDEFLSMASHQLRTPLTSIKGYLSMILEGDVGRITKAQRQVLDEAFTSSQRMVHLIHDFLNVSRLQTGKFMLEKEQCDIAGLVSEEVETLGSVAASRGITITYKTDFKSVMMEVDDTKLRQVVVNFIDNALYYSPSGSHVEVRLNHNHNRLEFTVKDDGIGVPKVEQAHLFGKFYRATNARKQRPDGTGVGLYLAKKIIVAHKGDVLFVSREGRGSTFGFWLPLEDSTN